MITNSRYGKVYLSLLRSCLTLMLILTAYYSQLALAQSDVHVAKLTASQRQWISQQGPIEFAVESDYGPFIFLDHEGEVKGLSVDVLQLIGRKTGLNFVPGPPSHLAEILKQAQANQIKLITSLRATPERSAFLNFSAAYASIPAVLALPLGYGNLLLRDLAGKRVAVGQGYAVEQFVRDTYPEVQWIAVPDDLHGIKAMQAGDVVAVVADLASLHFLRRFADTPEFQIAGKIGYTYELSFAFSKSQTELAAIVQAGLQAISPEQRDGLLTKWMPPPQTFSPWDYQVLPWILLSLVLAGWFAFRYFYKSTPVSGAHH